MYNLRWKTSLGWTAVNIQKTFIYRREETFKSICNCLQISNAMVLETNYFKWINCRFLKWNNGSDSFPGIFHATTIMFKILDIVIFFTLLYPYQYNEWPGATKGLETVVLQTGSGGSIRRWDSSVAFSLSICTAPRLACLKKYWLVSRPKRIWLAFDLWWCKCTYSDIGCYSFLEFNHACKL